MANFCKQCSIELFGKDLKNFAGLGKLGTGEGFAVICEGCRYILVNEDGECIRCDIKRHDGADLL